MGCGKSSVDVIKQDQINNPENQVEKTNLNNQNIQELTLNKKPEEVKIRFQAEGIRINRDDEEGKKREEEERIRKEEEDRNKKEEEERIRREEEDRNKKEEEERIRREEEEKNKKEEEERIRREEEEKNKKEEEERNLKEEEERIIREEKERIKREEEEDEKTYEKLKEEEIAKTQQWEHDEPIKNCVFLTVKGSYKTQKQVALDHLNKIRKEACDEHVKDPATGKKLKSSDYKPFKWCTYLEKITRIRAVESAFSMAHKRMNGVERWNVYNSKFNWAESLAWNWDNANSIDMINQWYDEKKIWVTGGKGVTGHYEFIISTRYQYVGLGWFNTNCAKYPNTLAGAFCGEENGEDRFLEPVLNIYQPLEVLKSRIKSYYLKGQKQMYTGTTQILEPRVLLDTDNSVWPFNSYKLNYISNDESVAKVSKFGKVRAIKKGATSIKCLREDKSIFATFDIKVECKHEKKLIKTIDSTTTTKGKNIYKCFICNISEEKDIPIKMNNNNYNNNNRNNYNNNNYNDYNNNNYNDYNNNNYDDNNYDVNNYDDSNYDDNNYNNNNYNNNFNNFNNNDMNNLINNINKNVNNINKNVNIINNTGNFFDIGNLINNINNNVNNINKNVNIINKNVNNKNNNYKFSQQNYNSNYKFSQQNYTANYKFSQQNHDVNIKIEKHVNITRNYH